MSESIITKTFIDGLNAYKVSVSTQKYIKYGENEYPIEQPNRTAFENSLKGREELKSKVDEPYLSAIMAVWGDSPTVEIPEIEVK